MAGALRAAAGKGMQGLALLLLGAVSALAEAADTGKGAPETEAARFQVKGERLIYDTTILIEGKERDIRYDDVEVLRDTLRANPQVTTLELNSTGGGHYPAMDLAAVVIDFGLDTHVSGTCESSCVSVFLGGAKRTLARGGRIGFHQLYWSESAVEKYYEDNRERREWGSPFEFAEWMYQDTQTETYNRLIYMLSRGVKPEFAIQTLRRPDTSMWFPYRPVLMAAGVLTD